jgi:poly(A) polymerase
MDVKRIEKEMLQDLILSKLSNLAKEENVPLYLVGGYIRDLFLGIHRPAYRQAGKDYDLTLPKEAFSSIERIEETLHLHFFKVGKEETGTATYRIIKEDMSFDLTLFQGRTIEEDLQRRDFTINAIAFSLRDNTFHWSKRTLEDIEKKVIHVV